MFKKKSFDLVHKRDIKKSKACTKHGCIRCLILPALMCFTLLLILVNIDFAGHRSETISKISSSSQMSRITDARTLSDAVSSNEVDRILKIFHIIPAQNEVSKHTNIDKKMLKITEKFKEAYKTYDISVHASKGITDICTEKTNPCTLSCSGTLDDKALNKRLEDLYKKCKTQMEITLQASNIKALGNNFLFGNFQVKKLIIFNSLLETINGDAFNKPSLKTLKSLVIIGSTLTKIDVFTFEGLENLEHFEIYNKESLEALEAKAFLKPMAKTLNRLIFRNPSQVKVYDPKPWFDGGENFVNLIDVDLSGNSFFDTLHKPSFERFIRVKILNLKNCNIRYFAEDTFMSIKKTLEKLDLSRNQLKTLSENFLQSMSGTGIVISLMENIWDCSCNNLKFVENIKNTKVDYSEEPICAEPPHLTGVDIKNINEFCDTDDEKSTTVSTFAPTITSTMPKPIENIEFVCKKITDVKSTIDTSTQYIAFTIFTVSSTTIKVEFSTAPKKIQLYYFEKNQNLNDVKITDVMEKLMLINDLESCEDYIFCAVPRDMQNFSPYNCRSHHMELNFNCKKTPWLKTRQKTFFIGLTVLGIIIFLLIGIAMIFFVLRWRPTMIKGNKRLLKLKAGCNQVFLSKENDTPSTEELYDALRTYVSLYNSSMLDMGNGYVQHHGTKNRNRAQPIYGTYFPQTTPPSERAPAMPPVNIKRTVSELSTIPANDNISLDSICEKAEEHEYQYLELYQKVYK